MHRVEGLLIFFHTFEYRLDVTEYLISAKSSLRRTDECRRKLFPKLQNLSLHLVHLLCKSNRSVLVTLGEDDGEWNLTLTQLDQEVHIHLTDVMS